MKTAMQELIDELKTISTQISKEGNIDMVAALSYAIDAARESIEKEKEQIIDAFKIGVSEGLSMENNTLGYDANPTIYYNQTFNKNK